MSQELIVVYLRNGEEKEIWARVCARFPGRKDKYIVLVALRKLDELLKKIPPTAPISATPAGVYDDVNPKEVKNGGRGEKK